MSTYVIKWLKDKLGTRFFPVTHINAVRDDTGTSLASMLEAKQDTLVSGTNIKTVNNNSLVGSGNVSIATGDTNVIETVKVNGTALTPDSNKAVNISAVTSFNGSTGAVTYTAPVTSVNGETGAVTLSIPSEVTESTVSGWGFTKNVGTITGITMNGASKGTSGVVNLGTVITSHQDISGKADKSTTTTAGTYKSVTVNSSGIVTGGSNPTTIAGYGITDAYTKSEVDGVVDDYLPLTGGTLGASSLAVYPLTLNTIDTSNNAVGITFTVSGNVIGRLFSTGTHLLKFNDTTDSYTIYHSGNFVAGTDYQTPIPANTYAPYNAAGYLPLNGGVMDGYLLVYGTSLNTMGCFGSSGGYISFGKTTTAGSAGTRYGFISMTSLDGSLYRCKSNYSGYMMHDDGNYSGGSGSDKRLKENIKSLQQDDAKDVLSKLNPVEFDWNEKAKEIDKRKIEQPHDVGFIAQDVEKIVPSAVTADYAGDYLRLDTAKFVAYLVKGWQEHEAEIAELKRDIAEIKEMLKKVL